MRLVEGSLSSLWQPLLGCLFCLDFGSCPQEDLSPLNLGMKYAEQNVKHPPMNIGGGVSATSYYTTPTWFCTHMVLQLGSAYVSSNFKIFEESSKQGLNQCGGSSLCFREPPGWSVFLHRLRLMLVFKYGVSWVSRFQCFFG